MSAHMTAPPAAAAPTRQWWATAVGGFVDFEVDADPAVCLHLEADECDHARYRCRVCCPHDDPGATVGGG